MRTRGGAGELLRNAALSALLCVAVAGQASAQDRPMVAVGPEGMKAQDDPARAIHLLSRATWGARPGDVAAAEEMGLKAWLDRQLDPKSIDDAVMDSRIAMFPTTTLSMGELYAEFSPQPGRQQEQQRLQMLRDSLGEDHPEVRALTAQLREQNQQTNPAQLLNQLVGAKIQRAVYSERQLEDVMADFWFNHFNVYFQKGQDRYLIADYERSAIRPHVFGKFEDMLIATAQHPAMLFYLDNWQSVYAEGAGARGRGAGGNGQQLMRRIPQMTEQEKQALVRSGRITEEQLAQLERGEMPSTPLVPAAPNRERGLNENYARELMELHTLGVDGGYSQQDVVEVARAFTGWTFQPYRQNQQQRPNRPDMTDMTPDMGGDMVGGQPTVGARGRGTPPPGGTIGARGRGVPQPGGAVGARPGAANRAAQRGRAAAAQRNALAGPQAYVGEGDVPFIFRPADHDPGEKTVLGKKLENSGMQDGLDVIHMLATHPSTAKFIATKLVERFVSDDPPADLVAEIADVFLKTDGDLEAVTRALFTSEAFYRAEFRGAKVKTPYELVVSSLRVTHASVGPSPVLLQTLRAMGHLPYTEPAPTGFPAMSEDWVNTGAMLARMTFGLDLAAGRVTGARVDIPAIAPRAGANPDVMLAGLLPGTETAALAAKINAELTQDATLQQRQRATRALGLALGSPEFQRR